MFYKFTVSPYIIEYYQPLKIVFKEHKMLTTQY